MNVFYISYMKCSYCNINRGILFYQENCSNEDLICIIYPMVINLLYNKKDTRNNNVNSLYILGSKLTCTEGRIQGFLRFNSIIYTKGLLVNPLHGYIKSYLL